MLRPFLLPFIALISGSDLLASPQSRSQSMGFDVNDVSVLFPLDSSDQPSPAIRLDEGGLGLVSNAVFSDLMTVATEEWMSAPAGSSIMKREHWSIVGFRYDPCAPADHGAEQSLCVQELRLIAQPIGSFGPADSSLHLVYKLGEGWPTAKATALVDLLNLKRQNENLAGSSTAGQPLGVQPQLAKALTQNIEAIPLLYKDFVLKHALATKLHKLTMMGLRDGNAVDWKFIGGNVINNRWQATTVPNLTTKAQSVELNLAGGAEVFTPLPEKTTLSTDGFFNSNPEGVMSVMETLNQAVHTLENPALTNRNTVDCVSCHTATTIRLARNFPFTPSLRDVSAKVPSRITGFPAPQMLGAHPTHWNLRAFGYFGLAATVSMRTVHETAQTAERLNTILNLKAPGRDCSAVEPEVMSCFVDSSRLFGTVKATETCLETCRP